MLIAACVMGLLGSGHCLGMCGGVSAALTFAIPSALRKRWLILSYNLGRVSSYGLMGLLVGVISAGVPSSGLPLARIGAGIMLVLTGLYIASWWRGLVHLEKVGRILWRKIKPLGDHLLPVDTVPKALAFGMVWGWLPCGLVYSALVFAATAASPPTSALLMLAFGAGTLPAVVAGGFAAARLKPFLQRTQVRLVLGLAYILFGCWTIYGALGHSGHAHGLHESGFQESGHHREHQGGQGHENSEHQEDHGQQENHQGHQGHKM